MKAIKKQGDSRGGTIYLTKGNDRNDKTKAFLSVSIPKGEGRRRVSWGAQQKGARKVCTRTRSEALEWGEAFDEKKKKMEGGVGEKTRKKVKCKVDAHRGLPFRLQWRTALIRGAPFLHHKSKERGQKGGGEKNKIFTWWGRGKTGGKGMRGNCILRRGLAEPTLIRSGIGWGGGAGGNLIKMV